MSVMFSRLLQCWKRAASDLGLQITAPFSLLLSSGHRLEAILLIHQFGGENGMLVIGSYDEVAPYVDEIVEAGYGFSILGEPKEGEEYNSKEYIELLADWGWTGDDDSRPFWL